MSGTNKFENTLGAIGHPWQKWGGITYAQYGEDYLILNLFNNLGMDVFSYLDIGASNPFVISNTALLYEKGCRGINVEANPLLIDEFIRLRPDDKNINIGIGIDDGVCPFYSIGDISSFNIEEIEWWNKKWKYTEQMTVQDIKVITLDRLISEYCSGIFQTIFL